MKSVSAKPETPEPGKAHYRRILLKLSGEVFAGGGEQGIFDYGVINGIADQICEIHALGVSIGLVVGAGNIFRGSQSAPPGMDRVAGDYMGMLGTIINAICLQDALEQKNLNTRVMTAIEVRAIAEPYIKRRAERHLDLGRVVIFAGGTGHPFFTTDTAAALRASEIGADVLIKGTKVDGIYDKDPKTNKDAVRFERLSFQDVLQRELRVMDTTAVAFCKDNQIPILVMNIEEPRALFGAVRGEAVGTYVD